MTGVQESDRCYFCGGKLVSDVVTVPFVIGSKVVVIREVPAQVCTQCGEVVLSSEVAEIIDRFLKQIQYTGVEVSVITYGHLKEVAEREPVA